MFTTRLTKLSRASLAGAVLLVAAFLLLSVTQAQAQTRKARARTGKARAQTEKTLTPASSLADVTLKPKAKLLVILGTGEKVNGKADNIGAGTLSIKLNIDGTATFPRQSKIRTLSESQIFQIYQVKGSRGMGVLCGALIGAVSGIVVIYNLPISGGPDIGYTTLFAIGGAGIGSVIAAQFSWEKIGGVIYQNPAVSPPSWFKTGLLNFRDGRLSFAVPTTYLRPDNFDRFRVQPLKKNTKHIDLVRVDF